MLGDFVDFGGSSGATAAVFGNLRGRHKVMVSTKVTKQRLKIVTVAFMFSCHNLTSMKKGNGSAAEHPENEDSDKGALLNGGFTNAEHPIDKMPCRESGKEGHAKEHTRRHDCDCRSCQQGYHLAFTFNSSISLTGTPRMRDMSL